VDFRNFDSRPPHIGHWSMAFFGMEASKTCEALSSDRGPSRTWAYREIIELKAIRVRLQPDLPSRKFANIISLGKTVAVFDFLSRQFLMSQAVRCSAFFLLAFQWRSMHVLRYRFLLIAVPQTLF